MNKHVYNMIATINNGQLAKKSFVVHRNKKICQGILNVLWDEGFILGYKISQNNIKTIKIFLKYKNGFSVISLIKVLSKPSLRVYYSVKQLWKLDSSKGMVILSTNKGFMSDNNCKNLCLGGEPILLIK